MTYIYMYRNGQTSIKIQSNDLEGLFVKKKCLEGFKK